VRAKETRSRALDCEITSREGEEKGPLIVPFIGVGADGYVSDILLSCAQLCVCDSLLDHEPGFTQCLQDVRTGFFDLSCDVVDIGEVKVSPSCSSRECVQREHFSMIRMKWLY